jgi:HK97 family phage prohead protease
METKLFASINDVKSVDDKDRIIEFTATKEIRDYDNDIVKIDGLDINKIKKNKSFLWSHQMAMPPVGKITKIWKSGDVVKGQAQMTSEKEYEFGYTIYKLIKGGYINNVSMSFIPDYKSIEYKEEKDGTSIRVINKSTMLEVSAVNIGANNATSIQAKSFKEGINKAWEADIIDGSELLELEKLLEEKETEGKPYKDEHACRLNDPKNYDKFARKNCEMKHDGKCIDVIYGIKGKKSEIQALRFKTDVWTEAQVKTYCKDKEGLFEPAKKVIESSLEVHTEIIDKEAIQSKLDEAEIKIAELELQLSEQKMDEEIEEDNLYAELFEEFSLAASDGKSADGKQTEELIDDLKNLRKEE